jgi:hypothetical protein
MRSEEDLVRTLRAAAGHVQGPPRAAQGGSGTGGLTAVVAARRRAHRVRQRMTVALAAAAVVVVAGGTAAVLSRGGGQAEPAAAVATTSADPAEAQIRPAAEVWPQAVFTMPAKAADGWRYQPVTGISATEVLLSAESSFEKAGRLEVYDATAGRARVLGDVPNPVGVKGYFPQRFDVGERYIAWYGETPNNADKWADFWIMPMEGGQATQLREVTGTMAEVDRIGVAGDSVVWSVRKGGVYRIPLTGGDPERIAGTDGLHLTSWPWAAFTEPDGRGGRNTKRLVNLETGESVDVQAPAGATKVACTPSWCYAMTPDGRPIVQRADGSDRKTLPASLTFFGSDGLMGDRFVHMLPSGTFIKAAYDPVTGRLAGLSKQAQNGAGGLGFGTSSSPTTIAYWDEDVEYYDECTSEGESRSCETKQRGGGKQFTVLNLAAVKAGN